MLYMVVERFNPDTVVELYRVAKERGRMLPDGLEYVASWVDLNFSTCFQLMWTENEELFQEWIRRWQALGDFGEFDIIPVRTSAEAFEVMARRL